LKRSIPVGKIFGISIRIHPSWVVIFGLVVWALASSYFPINYPRWPLALSVGVSVATSLLFFVSVLLHELSHSLVARHYNIPVSSITLFILGGVAEITEEPREPKAEFLIAIAGPLSSMFIGLIFAALWLFLPLMAEIVIAVSFWLAWINLMLGIFNLVPGFPMDGGRVLRSLIWWKTGDLDRSTRIASSIGQGIGLLFIIGGVSLIFYGMLLNGLWISLIGWFIRSAAASSYRQLTLRQLMKGHKAKDVMTDDCRLIDPGLNIEQLVNDYILTSGRRCFAAGKDGRVEGVVTLQEIKNLPRDEWKETKIGQIMAPLETLQSIGPEDELEHAFKLLTSKNINQLPVIEEGRLLGMLARDNLLNFISLKEGLSLE
jgi:Zn-dependent protease/predicted transcriptional regulator